MSNIRFLSAFFNIWGINENRLKSLDYTTIKASLKMVIFSFDIEWLWLDCCFYFNWNTFLRRFTEVIHIFFNSILRDYAGTLKHISAMSRSSFLIWTLQIYVNIADIYMTERSLKTACWPPNNAVFGFKPDNISRQADCARFSEFSWRVTWMRISFP